MNILYGAVGRLMLGLGLLVSLCLMAAHSHAADASSMPFTMTEIKENELMKKGEQCMSRSHVKTRELCCDWWSCSKRKRDSRGCCPGWWSSEYKISYWEPSAVIEVSCRTGYSMLAPGKVGSRLGGGDGASAGQSCVGMNKPGGGNFFFEARVWAINGYDGNLRHIAMGGANGEKMRQCTEDVGTAGDTKKTNIWGYGGKKWKSSFMSMSSGPGNSWEAYISDKDPEWAKPAPSGSMPRMPQQCPPNSNNMANCWGPMNETGWVTHMNPKVGAALVAWRAHEKARKMGKVSEPGNGGYQMMMDFPFQGYSGASAASMGLPNGGKTGSACFKPGDSGPAWYGGFTPEQTVSIVQGMKPGDPGAQAEINPGVYVFTVWVHTSCTRYVIPKKKPTPICFYQAHD
ncbi:MAG: hypothetical protein DI585_06520 [Pseudomonas fluorescens]|nr:MAG: hypothetical protein DI585_06520 [Pseudomonas fluorescens]